jgi:hypothetical protein
MADEKLKKTNWLAKEWACRVGAVEKNCAKSARK